MNTGIGYNNKGIKFAISNFKLENGFYLNPDIRRAWTIARDAISQTELLNPKAVKGSDFHQWAIGVLPKYRFLFEELTMLHPADVYDALYVAAERFHKAN
jgi:hypothetical protein